MTRDVPKSVSDYMAKIGAQGGKNGKGKKKKRGNAEHYRKMVEARERKREAERG